MRSLRVVFVVTFLLILASPPNTGAVAPAGPEIVVRVKTPRFVSGPAGVAVHGYSINDVPGAPALPLYGTVVELPPTGDWVIDVTTDGTHDIPAPSHIPAVPQPVGVQPNPHGSARPVLEGLSTVDAPDRDIYERDEYYPQSIACAGEEQWYRGKRLLALRVFPFQYNPVRRLLHYHPDITVTVRVLEGPDHPSETGSAAITGRAAGQTTSDELGALLIRTRQRGLHRLTYSDLSAAGVPVATVNPASFQITYLGEPVRIQVTGSEDGVFHPQDLVIFYAEPYSGRWMTANVYRFSYGTNSAPSSTCMTTRTVERAGPVVTQVDQSLRIEKDAAYYYDYEINTEADHFFDSPLYPSISSGTTIITRSYELRLDDPVIASGMNMEIRGLLYGGKNQAPEPDNWAKLRVNAHDAAVYAWEGRQPFTITATTAPMTWLDRSPNMLHLVADLSRVSGVSGYWYNPDFIEVSYPALAEAEDDRIDIAGVHNLDPHLTALQMQVTGFSSGAVNIYDVRDPRNPVQILSAEAVIAGASTQINFWDAWAPGAPPPAYALSTLSALLAPASVEVDVPSRWRSPDNWADYIAVVHASLADAIQPLLDLRTRQGLHVARVDVQDIYDEFNFGLLHQNAIRDFLEYAYDNWNQGGPRPKYVLLVGDATPDYRNSGVTSLKNLLPTFLINIDPWIVETAADNRFVSFDGPRDYLPEMSIGRIPAQDAEGVANYVNKAIAYSDPIRTPDGDWQKKVVYVADSNTDSAGRFHDLSEDIRLNWLPASYSSSTIYYKSVPALDSGDEMKAAIKTAFDGSAIFLQWFGHASRYAWGGETFMWQRPNVHGLAENMKAPFLAAFSCWDGYFINMDQYGSELTGKVLSEVEVLEPGRGSIANLSPTGQHVGRSLSVLDQGLTKSFFYDKQAIIGDAVDAAKLYYYANSSVFHDVIDTSVLFGDPALALRLPGPTAAPEAPWVYIDRNGDLDVDLNWGHVSSEAAYYEVYRSTDPHPEVGFAPTNRIRDIPAGSAYGSGYTFVITDDGIDRFAGDGTMPPVQIVGDSATNYFWIVRSRNSAAETSDIENIVGEFDFALVKGS